MRRLALLIASVAVIAAACSGGSSPAPTGTPEASDPPTTGTLNRAPANLGCDAMAPGYASVTFHVDGSAAEAVTATTDTGETLMTYWSDGFHLDDDGHTVLDADGREVVPDNRVLEIPTDAWPRLDGYFVCPSTDAIYVLETDPE